MRVELTAESLPDYVEGGDCLIWTGSRFVDGYGRYGQELAHRVVWRLLVGKCPEGLEPDHRCRVKACVNLAHIEWVTHQVNVARAVRRTHCLRGHDRRTGDLYGANCGPCARERVH